jgi:hypothetical protein
MTEIKNPDGSLVLQNANARDLSTLAQDLTQGYYAYASAMSIAMDTRSDALIPEVLPSQIVPVGFVNSKGGATHTFHFVHYLNQARQNPFIAHHLDRVYLSGALLTLGDALSQYNYFDRAPILELIRHLRNGIAHGNTFRIDNPSSLMQYPAHDNNPQNNNPYKFMITPELNGTPVLFDFMEAGDVIHELTQASFHLSDLAYGVVR